MLLLWESTEVWQYSTSDHPRHMNGLRMIINFADQDDTAVDVVMLHRIRVDAACLGTYGCQNIACDHLA